MHRDRGEVEDRERCVVWSAEKAGIILSESWYVAPDGMVPPIPVCLWKAWRAAAVVLPHVQRGTAQGTHHDRRALRWLPPLATTSLPSPYPATCRVAVSRRRRRLPPGQFRRRPTRYEQSYKHARRVGDFVPHGTRAFFFFCAYRMHSVHMKNGRTAARWAVTESSVRNAGGLDLTYLTALARTFLRGSSSHLCWNARAYLFNSPLTRTLLLCRVHVMSVNAAHVTGTCVPGQGTHVRSGSI